MKSVAYSVVQLDNEDSEAYREYMSTERRYDAGERDLFKRMYLSSEVKLLDRLVAEAAVPQAERAEVLQNLLVVYVFDTPSKRTLYFCK